MKTNASIADYVKKSCPIVQIKRINNKKPECYAVMATDEIREKKFIRRHVHTFSELYS